MSSFYSHLNVFKATFCVPCVIGQHGKTILTLLLVHNLDLQCSHFKMTMIHNFKVVMHDQKNRLNLVIRLWRKFTAFPIFNHKLSKYMKLIDIVVL